MLSTKIHVFTENNLRALLNWSEDAQLELCEHRTVSNGPRKRGGGLISKKKKILVLKISQTVQKSNDKQNVLKITQTFVQYQENGLAF